MLVINKTVKTGQIRLRGLDSIVHMKKFGKIGLGFDRIELDWTGQNRTDKT